MASTDANGNHTPSLAAILNAPGGPTYRQVEHWVRRGFLRPDTTAHASGRPRWTWSDDEAGVAVRMARLAAAGLRVDVAEKVARQSPWGAVVLAPGVLITLFPTSSPAVT